MEDLIEKNMGLVIAVVNKFNPRNSLERDRYIQAGRIGLMESSNEILSRTRYKNFLLTHGVLFDGK